ncbi:hypothetical protein F383_21053 [Gossypium arboreum]|uniref:Uncharacterized protein n=1 Tax=Gossypium arboreum TaxID=29729 RepID=A0A0B0NPB2_GOSAR|nr:hypothetical protein F383_21053 [Gossypium arboreum]
MTLPCAWPWYIDFKL